MLPVHFSLRTHGPLEHFNKKPEKCITGNSLNHLKALRAAADQAACPVGSIPPTPALRAGRMTCPSEAERVLTARKSYRKPR